MLPLCALSSSHSKSARDGALGREKRDTGCRSGHSLATLCTTMHPRGTHSSEWCAHTHRERKKKKKQ